GNISAKYFKGYVKQNPGRTTRAVQGHVTHMRGKFIETRDRFSNTTGAGVMDDGMTIEEQKVEECHFYMEGEDIWGYSNAVPPYTSPPEKIGRNINRTSSSSRHEGAVPRTKGAAVPEVVATATGVEVAAPAAGLDAASSAPESHHDCYGEDNDAEIANMPATNFEVVSSCSSEDVSNSSSSEEEELAHCSTQKQQQKGVMRKAATRIRGIVAEAAMKKFSKAESESFNALSAYQNSMLEIERKRLMYEKEFQNSIIQCKKQKVEALVSASREKNIREMEIWKSKIEFARLQLEIEKLRSMRPNNTTHDTVDVSSLNFLSQ
ncbi:unnamed protein product, partial [Allacma fusca]